MGGEFDLHRRLRVAPRRRAYRRGVDAKPRATPRPPRGPHDSTGDPRAAAVAGLACAAVTVGVAELGAGLVMRAGWSGGTPSPVDALGGAFIDRTPPWLKGWAVDAFGTHDKAALYVGIACVLVVLGCLLGVVAARARAAGLIVFGGLVAVAGAAVLSRPGAGPADLGPLLLGAVAGWWVLRRSTRPPGRDEDQRERGQRGQDQSERDRSEVRPRQGVGALGRPLTRRAAIGSGLVAIGAGAAGIVVGRVVAGGARGAAAARAAFAAPGVAATVTVPAGADLRVPGVTPFIVPDADFYRIDTALTVPQVDPAGWSLRVTGLVEREITIDWATLLAKPMTEAMVTLMCVSNEVGGTLNGNAIWTGWPVRDLLAEAGVRAGADMVLSRSVDGFTAGTPLEALTDARDALLVVAQNGQALLPEHGYPVRLVVPGLYGYVSATKWVSELKVTTFAADEGYWTPRGWSALAPVKTQSRIDVPRDGATLPDGTVAVAGVAWAQHRGVTGVQVSIDAGDWQDARLGADATIDAWRQWVYEWEPTPGAHTIAVRAVDATGVPQTATPAPAAPDGATGHHTITVTVA